jgi:hypothetical protein
MFVKRVLPDPQMQEAIIDAAADFEVRVADAVLAFYHNCATHDYAPTERVIEQEMMI